MTKTVVDDQTGDEDEETVLRACGPSPSSAPTRSRARRLSEFQVHEDEGQPDAQPDFQPAEELILATEADIRYGGNRAYYSRPLPAGAFPNHSEGDFIVLPPQATFDPPGAFYETAVHELAHWSEARTGWDHDKQGYALGELAAEIASCYVAAELGIPQGEGLGQPCRLPEELAGGAEERPQLHLQGGQAGDQGHRLPAGLRQEARTRSSGGDANERNHRHLPQGQDGMEGLLRPLPRTAQRRVRSIYCTAYQHVGQHCAADYHGCIAQSDPATPAEYADLYEELERRGYILSVRRRATPEMHERRRRIAAEWRGAALENS